MKKFILITSVVILLCVLNLTVFASGEIEISSINSDSEGNIFFDGEEKVISLDFKNNLAFGLKINVDYIVTDLAEANTDTIYYSSSTLLKIPQKSVCTDTISLEEITKYGVYVLKVSAYSSDGAYSFYEEIPFSVCVDAYKNGGNPKFQISMHTAINGDASQNIAMPIVKKGGFSGVRDSYLWYAFEGTSESEKGKYNEPAAYTNFLEEVNENKLGAYMIVHGGNKAYGTPMLATMPNDDISRAGFAEYVYQMLLLNKDKIYAIEVWNEPNMCGAKESADGADGAVEPLRYAKLLRAVYERIRQNPEFDHIKIAGPTLASITLYWDWLEEFLAADTDGDGESDMYKYFDILSIHHYFKKFYDIPEVLNHLKDLMVEYNCGDKEIYYTEFGRHQADRNHKYDESGTTTQHMQASRIARYYLTLSSNDVGEKFFLYTLANEDDIIESNYGEATYGIVNDYHSLVPYSAKAAFVAMANINNIFNDNYTDECTNYTMYDNGLSVAEFTSPSGDKVINAIYVNEGAGDEIFESFVYNLPVDYNADAIKFYDLYGNNLSFPVVDGNYVINATCDAIYAVYEYNDSIKLYLDGENAVIKGKVDGAQADEYLTIKVLDDKNSIVYIEEFMLDESGDFEISFKIPEVNSQYMLNLGNKNFNGVYSISFNPCLIKKATFYAVNEGNAQIMDLSAFSSAEKIVIKAGLINPNIDGFDIIVAYYNDNELKTITHIDNSDMTLNNEKYTYDLKKVSNEIEFDKLKIFMFNSLTEIIPLCESIVFN